MTLIDPLRKTRPMHPIPCPCPDADLWILAGQSNMQGYAPFQQTFDPHPRLWSLGADYRWEPAVPPLHHLNVALDPVHRNLMLQGVAAELLDEQARGGRAATPRMAGAGYFFALHLLQTLGDAQSIALLPCAHGGTSLGQWSPDTPGAPGETLYNAMLKRWRASSLPARGLLWYQGESDAAPGLCDTYAERFLAFAARLRRDLAQPDLPILTVQIGRCSQCAMDPYWEKLRAQQLEVIKHDPRIFLTTVIDAALADPIHCDLAAQQSLAARFAAIALREVYGQPGPDSKLWPERLEVIPPSPENIFWRLRLHLHGQFELLTSPGLPAGFRLTTDPPLEPAVDYWRIDLNAEGNPRQIDLWLNHLAEGRRLDLTYGPGSNPLCNVSAGVFPLPAFGPLALEI